MHRNSRRRFHADADFATLNSYDAHANVAVNDDLFADAPRQYEHALVSCFRFRSTIS
jgi:hypothetical protein